MAVDRNGRSDGTGSGGVEHTEVKTSSNRTSTVSSTSSSSATSKPTATGLKRQASKTASSKADKGKQKRTSEVP